MIQTAKQEQKIMALAGSFGVAIAGGFAAFANTYTKWFYQFFFWNLFSLIVLVVFY
jgi:hypothetical protein